MRGWAEWTSSRHIVSHCLSPRMEAKLLSFLLLTLCLPSDQQAGWTSLSESSQRDGRDLRLQEVTGGDSQAGWTSLLDTNTNSHPSADLLEDTDKEVVTLVIILMVSH